MIVAISGSQSPPRPAPNLDDNLKKQILEQLQRFSKSLTSIESHINDLLREENFEKILNKSPQNHFYNCSVQPDTKTNSSDESELDGGTIKAIEEIFGTNLDANLQNINDGKSKCKQNCCNGNLRSGSSTDCKNAQQSRNMKKGNKKKKKRPLVSLIDIRGNFGTEQNSDYDDSEESYESTTIDNAQEEFSTTEIITTTDTDILGVKRNDTVSYI